MKMTNLLTTWSVANSLYRRGVFGGPRLVRATAAKAWVLPDGSLVPVSRHEIYLFTQAKDVERRFKWNPAKTHKPDDEWGVRMDALKRGFVRLAYELRNGIMTVEAHTARYSGKVRVAVEDAVLSNANEIDTLIFRLLNDRGNVVKSREATVFRLDGEERREQLLETLQ